MNGLLASQLRRLGLSAESPPADPDMWQHLLERVGRSYDDADRNRYLLDRSMHISSQEMGQESQELQHTIRAREEEQQDVLHAVIDALTDGMCTLDTEGRVKFANPAAVRMLETDLEAVIGTAVLNRFRFWPDEPSHTIPAHRAFRVATAGHRFSDDTALLTRPGQDDLPVSCVMTPIGVGADASGVVFVFRDLSERRRTLEAMERSEDHYRNLFHSIPIAVFEEDFTAVGDWLARLRRAGVSDLLSYLKDHPDELRGAIGLIEVLDVNPAALDMLEAEDATQLIGPLRNDTFTEETLESWRQQLLAIWEERDSVHLELQGNTVRGNRLDGIFHLAVSRVGGRPDLSKVLVALTDITERKQAEDQLADLVRSKNEFVAAVSHELRTPLTAVYGSASLLRDSWAALDDGDKVELVGHVARESRELTDLVQDLLVAARADMGNLSVSPEVVDLRVEIIHALDAVQTGPSGRNIDITRVAGTAFADPLRLRQIVRNLISNALRYGGNQITVATDHHDEMVTVQVTDDGDGIPSSQNEAIFEAYHRADRTQNVPGSVGLGLTIARRLAILMNGNLAYRRSNGLTIFELQLPTVADQSLPPDPVPPDPPALTDEATATQPIRQP